MKNCFLMARLFTLSMLLTLASARDPKSIEHLSRCIKMAEPLVRDPRYIFPLTVQDIKDVCRMWEEFIGCVYQYANTYMALAQQQDFNKTIKNNIEIIQKLCTGDAEYHKMYMAYAPCMKRVSVESTHCGNQYRHLTDLVQGGSMIDGKLCCAHRTFRECVLDTTAIECDAGGVLMGAGNSPSQFMKDMLDQTMGFLLQRCKDFVANSRDCPSNNIGSRSSGNAGASINESGNRNSNSNNDNADTLVKNNNNLPPVSMTGESSSPHPPPPPPFTTTRFTWTTKGPREGVVNRASKPTSDYPVEEEAPNSSRVTPSLNLGGSGLLGPASQQYKDTGKTIGAPAYVTVLLLTIFVFNL